jgi:hypothetical protein
VWGVKTDNYYAKKQDGDTNSTKAALKWCMPHVGPHKFRYWKFSKQNETTAGSKKL